MNYKFFEELESTQSYLLESYQSIIATDKNILVATRNQTNGVGRHHKIWDHYKNGIACSFILSPNEKHSLTSLEIGVHVTNFFADQGLGLKWPNDLLNKNKRKCGGIISVYQQPWVICGLGININQQNFSKYEYAAGSIEIIDSETDIQKDTPLKLYEYILKNRLSASDTIAQWTKLCMHIGDQVKLVDSNTSICGIFNGIGPDGEALIDSNKYYTGSLLLN